jgi:hypothetical protein
MAGDRLLRVVKLDTFDPTLRWTVWIPRQGAREVGGYPLTAPERDVREKGLLTSRIFNNPNPRRRARMTKNVSA